MRLYNHVDLHFFYAFRYLVYIDYMGYLSNIFLQNLGLLDTLQNLKSTGGSGEIVVFNTVVIGHTKHPHEQLHGRL